MCTKLRGKMRSVSKTSRRALWSIIVSTAGAVWKSVRRTRKSFASDLERVKGYLAQGFKTIISIAPSYAGVLDFDQPGQVVDALLKLGFYEVRETAEGAALVTNEYKKSCAGK